MTEEVVFFWYFTILVAFVCGIWVGTCVGADTIDAQADEIARLRRERDNVPEGRPVEDDDTANWWKYGREPDEWRDDR